MMWLCAAICFALHNAYRIFIPEKELEKWAYFMASVIFFSAYYLGESITNG